MKRPRYVTVLDSIMRQYPNGVTSVVVGCSMEPTLLNDDVILVDPHGVPQDRNVVVVKFEGKGAMVGRLRITPHGRWIAKDNPAVIGDAMLLPAAGYEIVGIVRTIVSRLMPRLMEPTE